jgi:hypothetical protein
MPYKKHQNALPSKGQFHGVIENLQSMLGALLSILTSEKLGIVVKPGKAE